MSSAVDEFIQREGGSSIMDGSCWPRAMGTVPFPSCRSHCAYASARKSDKKIWLPMLAHDCHCVLIPSVEVSWGACKGSWQDHWNSYTSYNASISCKHMVTKVVVQLCSQLCLVAPKVVQFGCLGLDPREAAKFLEQTLRSK